MIAEQMTSAFYSFTKTKVFKGLVTLATLYVILAVGYNLYKSLYPNPYVDSRNVLDDLSNKLFAQNMKVGRKNLSDPGKGTGKSGLIKIPSCTDAKTVRYEKTSKKGDFQIMEQDIHGHKENATHRKNAFREIYLKGEWTKNSSVSGPGSSLELTVNVRETLDAVFSHLKSDLNKTVIRMVDIPCGDFSWMRHFLRGRDDVIYTGLDIVPEIIDKLQAEWKNHSRVQFKLADIVEDPIEEPYDLIFSRHLTQHLTNQDSLRVLKSFSNSRSHYLLMTTYPNTLNSDLQYGMKFRFRAQNLELTPYALAPPICENIDGAIDVIALWQLPLLQISNCEVPSVLDYHKDSFGRRVYTCK